METTYNCCSKKLWDKGFSSDRYIEEFTVGNDRELDLELAEHDVEGSIAHIAMLKSKGLLSENEYATLSAGLREIGEQIAAGKFAIEDDVEDIHSQIELMLTRKFGESGKKIHSGRSRNDQVLTDIKLYSRKQLAAICSSATGLALKLTDLSDRYGNVLMPGYTHLQIAMPSSFGLWFGAYAETLADDLRIVNAAYDIADQNPLGSAAGYGSSFPLDREMTTELMGFGGMHWNVCAAQMSRGKCESAIAFAISSLASTIGKFAMDCCLYMCGNFGFISLPDEFTTGSSIMPHKKNPDVFEIIRGKCNRLLNLPSEVFMLTSNLPMGYQRDLQLLKDIIFPAVKEIMSVIDMTSFIADKIKINKKILDDPKYDLLFTVEEVNRLVLDGIPFRDAYRIIGNKVAAGQFSYNPSGTHNTSDQHIASGHDIYSGQYITSGQYVTGNTSPDGTELQKRHLNAQSLHHTHQGSIGNLCNDKIREKIKNIGRHISEVFR